MTEQELDGLIKGTVTAEVEKAIKAIHARNTDEAAHIVRPRVDIEGRGGQLTNDRSLTAETRGIALGGAVVYLARCRMDQQRAIDMAAKDKEWTEPTGVLKTLTAGEMTGGGVLITPQFSNDLIDLLAARTVVRRHVTNVVDISSGLLSMPRLSADAAMSWGDEIDSISESEPTLDQINLRPFQGKVLVPLSNTLIKRGGPRVAAMVRNSILRSWALGEDLAFLTSPGSESRPKGLRYWAADATQLAATAWTGTDLQKLQIVVNDLGRLILALEEANVPMTNPVWFMAPRTRQYLLTALNSVGAPAFPEVKGGTLYGWPIEVTTQIRRNEGSGSDESFVYLADCDELMIGQGQGLEIAMSSEASFVDADDNVVSTFQRNMSLVRLIAETGFAPQHREAIGYLSAVKWAPAAS